MSELQDEIRDLYCEAEDIRRNHLNRDNPYEDAYKDWVRKYNECCDKIMQLEQISKGE